MKNIISGLNKIFDSRIRLGIMALLVITEHHTFNELKELMEITDGNLATHLKALEKEEMITVQKQFIGRKPNTIYAVTPLGKAMFQEHLNALEQLIGNRTP